jgi:hypothetical protein
MISDLYICDNLIKLYSWKGEPGWWEQGDLGQGDHGIAWGALRAPDGVMDIYLRGSSNFLDWLRDFYAFANPFGHSLMGPVHPGFYVGLPETWAEMKRCIDPPYRVSGHSLGAGRACILTALMMLDGVAPIRRVNFGEPKPGFGKLADMISVVPAASYRNGDDKSVDEVTAVPLSFPPEMYVHPAGLVDVCAPPGSAGPQPDWGPLNFHHLPLYRQALVNLGIK